MGEPLEIIERENPLLSLAVQLKLSYLGIDPPEFSHWWFYDSMNSAMLTSGWRPTFSVGDSLFSLHTKLKGRSRWVEQLSKPSASSVVSNALFFFFLVLASSRCCLPWVWNFLWLQFHCTQQKLEGFKQPHSHQPSSSLSSLYSPLSSEEKCQWVKITGDPVLPVLSG